MSDEDRTYLEDLMRNLDTPKNSEKLKKRRGGITTRKRLSIFKRDCFRCCYCGSSPNQDKYVTLNLDHRIPVSKGGADTDDNLQTLCWECNNGKGETLEKDL